MEFFLSANKIWAKAKSSKWLAVALFIGWFVWTATQHAFFEWFNKQMVREVDPMMHLGGAIIKWTAENPVLFLVALAAFYSIFVIVGAQLSSFQWPWGKMPFTDVAQNLYDELIVSNMANNFKQLFVNPSESHDDVLNSLGEFLANENISMYGKPRHSTKMIEIKNLQQKLGNMEFRDGATSLCFLHKSEEFTDLHVKKKEARKAIERVMDKMPDILTDEESSKTRQPDVITEVGKLATDKQVAQSSKRPKSLFELFQNDFSNTTRISPQYTITIKGFSETIQTNLCLDFNSRSKFLGFYIKLSPHSYDICEWLSDGYKKIMGHIDSNIELKSGHMAEITQTSLEELVFSGRIYIYHEDLFSLQQLAELDRLYQSKGLSVVFRGQSYAWLESSKHENVAPPPPAAKV